MNYAFFTLSSSIVISVVIYGITVVIGDIIIAYSIVVAGSAAHIIRTAGTSSAHVIVVCTAVQLTACYLTS